MMPDKVFKPEGNTNKHMMKLRSRRTKNDVIRTLQEDLNELIQQNGALTEENQELREANQKYVTMVKNLRASRQHPPKL